MMYSNRFVILIFSLSFSSVVHCQNAPLLVWTSKDLSHCSPDIELKPELTVSSVFTEEYMKCLAVNPPQNVVVFILEAFSSEEIVNKVYQSLSNIQTSIKNSGFSIPSIKSVGVLDDLKLIADVQLSKSNFIVEYIEVLPEPAEENVDAYVMDSIQKLNGTYLAVLSSSITSQPSWDDNHVNVGRHLLEVAEKKGDTATQNTCIIGTCVQLCYSSLTFTSGKATASESSPTSTFDVQEGSCDTNNTSTSPKFVSVVHSFLGNDTKTLKINMTFEQKTWAMSGQVFWALYGINIINITELNRRTFYPDVSAPAGWSFGCASPESFTDSMQKYSLAFKDLRMQAFIKIKPDSVNPFGRMFDCSGWFTGPIWVGLLVSFLLITMLSFAYSMIGSITTMDKFDNPKGKTISVPQDS